MTQEEIKEAYFRTIDEYFKDRKDKRFVLRQIKSIDVGDTIVFNIDVINCFQYYIGKEALTTDFEFALIKKLGKVCKFVINFITDASNFPYYES